MARKKEVKPSPGELELLQVLWKQGPSTVKQVHEVVNAKRRPPKSMTTTLKIMQNMEEKGLVAREGDDRPQLFRPALEKEAAQSSLLEDLLSRAVQGDTSQLVLCALTKGDVSPEELDEIRKLLDAVGSKNSAEVKIQ